MTSRARMMARLALVGLTALATLRCGAFGADEEEPTAAAPAIDAGHDATMVAPIDDAADRDEVGPVEAGVDAFSGGECAEEVVFGNSIASGARQLSFDNKSLIAFPYTFTSLGQASVGCVHVELSAALANTGLLVGIYATPAFGSGPAKLVRHGGITLAVVGANKIPLLGPQAKLGAGQYFIAITPTAGSVTLQTNDFCGPIKNVVALLGSGLTEVPSDFPEFENGDHCNAPMFASP